MRKQRRQTDPYEQMLKQANDQQGNDDDVIQSVRHGDMETAIAEKRRRIDWTETFK